MNRIPALSIRSAIVSLTLGFLFWRRDCATGPQTRSKPLSMPPARESDFNRHLDELTSKLDSMRQQLIESQNEMDELRNELRSLRDCSEKNQTETAARDADALRASVTQIQDETEVLQAQVKQHDQSKVETSSKFPLRINGALLVTSIFNSSNSDNFNLPVVAVPPVPYYPRGSVSETASQTMLGFDASGPHLWGARVLWGFERGFLGRTVFCELFRRRRPTASHRACAP